MNVSAFVGDWVWKAGKGLSKPVRMWLFAHCMVVLWVSALVLLASWMRSMPDPDGLDVWFFLVGSGLGLANIVCITGAMIEWAHRGWSR